MNNEDKRIELAYRVAKMVTKDNHQTKKKCSVCNKSFLGRGDTSTCGPTCRKRKSRM